MSETRILLVLVGMLTLLCNCTSTKLRGDRIVVSVYDQRLSLIGKEGSVKTYPISTSKYGLGSQPRSYKTPLGKMYVCKMIGGGARSGTVFTSVTSPKSVPSAKAEASLIHGGSISYQVGCSV